MSKYGIGILALFFVYFKLIPMIDAETQPILFFISIIPILIKEKENILKIKLNKILILFLVELFLIVLVNIYKKDSGIKNLLIESFKYSMPLLGFLAYNHNMEKLTEKDYRVFKNLSYVWFINAVVIKFKIPILYTIFYKFSLIFFERAKEYNKDGRGISIFGPEPSYFAILLIFYLILLEYGVRNKKIEKDKEYYIINILLIVIAFFAKSLYVYLMLIIYYGFKIKLKYIISVLIAFLIFISLKPQVLNTSRIQLAIQNIKEHKNKYKRPIDILYYGDSSSGARFLLNSVGYNSIVKYPFGNGLGSFFEKNVDVSWELGYNYRKNGHFGWWKNVKTGRYNMNAQTYMSKLVFEIGIWSFILWYFFILKYFEMLRDKANFKQNLLIIVVTLFMLFIFQGQQSNPIPWVMLCFYSKNKKEKEQNG